MNFPALAGVAPPAPPAGFPSFSPPPAAPVPVAVPVDWRAKCLQLIPTKVPVNGAFAQNPEQVAWCLAHLEATLGAAQYERIAKALESAVLPMPLGHTPPAPSAPPVVDPAKIEAEVLALIPQRLTYHGKPCAGPPEQVKQMLGWLLANFVHAKKDPVVLLGWLHSLTAPYEIDDATRMQQTAAAPANPVSDRTAPQVAAPAPVEPETPGAEWKDPQDNTSYKTLRGLKTHVSKTHKLDWPIYCQTHGLDTETGRAIGVAVSATGTPIPTTPPPAGPALTPMLGTPGATAQAAMPAPVQHQMAPIKPLGPPPAAAPGPTVAFTPVVAPPQPQLPVSAAFGPAGAPQATGAMGVASFQPVSPTPSAGTPLTSGPLDRVKMAQMLGGEVDLVVVRLADTAVIDLTGRVDVNQLALLAEKQAREEIRVLDLAQSAYGAGKQAAQRHFADMLTKQPMCYLLMNGYDPILPDGYLEIAIARTTKAYVVTDQGKNFNQLKLA